MSAVPVNPHNGFKLFKRNASDVVKARPFYGDHNNIVASAASECANKHRDIIRELAKI